MPFQYERDDIKGRVLVTFRGAFQKSEGLAAIGRHGLEDVGSYSVFYDLLGLTGQPTLADLRSFMSTESAVATAKPRGPIAILAKDPMMYAMACTYAALGGTNLNIRVFRERDEADEWLTAQSRHQHVGR
jgi:hypothetical protein